MRDGEYAEVVKNDIMTWDVEQLEKHWNEQKQLALEDEEDGERNRRGGRSKRRSGPDFEVTSYTLNPLLKALNL